MISSAHSGDRNSSGSLSLSLSLHVAFKFQLPFAQIDHLQTGAMISHAGIVIPHVYSIYVQYPFPVAICEMCTKESWVESLMWWRYANLSIHSFALQGSAQTRKDLEQAMKSSWLLQSLKTWQIQTVRITQGNALWWLSYCQKCFALLQTALPQSQTVGCWRLPNCNHWCQKLLTFAYDIPASEAAFAIVLSL